MSELPEAVYAEVRRRLVLIQAFQKIRTAADKRIGELVSEIRDLERGLA